MLLALLAIRVGTASAQVALLRFNALSPQLSIDLPGDVGRPAIALAKMVNTEPFLDILSISSDGVQMFRGRSDDTVSDPVGIDVGGAPTALVTGLFNDDTNLDVAAIVDGDVVVALGNGDGTFQAPITSTVLAASPVAIATAKIDGDNILDIVLALSDESIYLMHGNGDGTFSEFSTPSLDTTQSGATAILAADVTGDGKVDVLVTNTLSDTVTLFPGRGDGTFGTLRQIDTGSDSEPEGITVGAIDSDPYVDLAVTTMGLGTGLDAVSVFPGQRSGTFLTEKTIQSTAEFAHDVALADVDNDHALDLISVGDLTGIGVQLNQLNGSSLQDCCTGSALPAFGDLQSLRGLVNQGDSMLQVVVGDVDNNGLIDIVALRSPSSGGMIAVAFNRSNDPTPTPTTGGSPSATVTGSVPPSATPTPTPPPTSTPTPTTIPTAPFGVCRFPVSTAQKLVDIASGDLNQDGKPDIVVADQAGSQIIVGMVNQPLLRTAMKCPTDFTLSGLTAISLSSAPAAVALGDLGVPDGASDIAVVTQGGLVILKNNGNGGFSVGDSFNVGSDGASVALSDLDRNGRLDIIVGHSSSTSVTILDGQADGGFTMRSVPLGRTQTVVTARDLNNDGRVDIATVNSATGELVALLQDSQVANGFRVLPPQSLNGTPTGLLADDFNHDGVADLALALNTGSPTGLLAMTGAVRGSGVSYSQASRAAAGGSPSAIGEGDFNRDGQVDVVVSNQNDSTLSFFDNMAGQFPRPRLPLDLVGVAPVALTVADFDGDGILDVATANQGDGSITILRSANPPPTPTPTQTGTPTVTPTPTISGTPTDTSTPTIGLTGTPTITGTLPTRTRTFTPTVTGTPTPDRPFGVNGQGCAVVAPGSRGRDWGGTLYVIAGLIGWRCSRRTRR